MQLLGGVDEPQPVDENRRCVQMLAGSTLGQEIKAFAPDVCCSFAIDVDSVTTVSIPTDTSVILPDSSRYHN